MCHFCTLSLPLTEMAFLVFCAFAEKQFSTYKGLHLIGKMYKHLGLIQTEIFWQLLDSMLWHFVQTFMVPQRKNPVDFGDLYSSLLWRKGLEQNVEVTFIVLKGFILMTLITWLLLYCCHEGNFSVFFGKSAWTARLIVKWTLARHTSIYKYSATSVVWSMSRIQPTPLLSLKKVVDFWSKRRQYFEVTLKGHEVGHQSLSGQAGEQSLPTVDPPAEDQSG